MRRRQFLRTAGAGIAGVGTAATMSGVGSSWRGIEIDAYCKGYLLAKFEVEGGKFKIENDQNAERVGPNTFKVYNHYFELDLEGSRFEENEIREFDFSTDSDIVDHVEVKGGPETTHYLENPLSAGSDGTGLHAPVNENAGGDQHRGVSYAAFKTCTGIAVDVTSTSSGAKPADIIDLTNDDIRLAVTHGPFHHDDQYLFDNGAGTKHGNGTIQGDGNLHLYFPFEDSFVDDPADVRNSSKFVADLLVEGADGTTYAGNDDLPPIV